MTKPPHWKRTSFWLVMVIWIGTATFYFSLCCNEEPAPPASCSIEQSEVTTPAVKEYEYQTLVVYKVFVGWQPKKILNSPRIPVYTEHHHLFSNGRSLEEVVRMLAKKHGVNQRDIAVQSINNNVKG